DYGLTPSVDVAMYIVSGIATYTNMLCCTMYKPNGTAYDGYSDSTSYGTDTVARNLIGSVSDNIFFNFGYVDTTYDNYYTGGQGSRVSSWTVKGR
ncbi:MAG: hypothetical protein IJW82_08405, partial [Clostridia bacterium]|nr:hypothetical protein [Clostridia bacterium]